jgi:hypothetical protein
LWKYSRNIHYTQLKKKRTSTKTRFDDIIYINPNDTVAIKKYSLKENFTIIDIKENSEHYDIIIQSDSMRTVTNTHPLTGKKENHSFYIQRQIVSLKSKEREECEEIKKGQQYELMLIPLLIYKPNAVPSMRYIEVSIKGVYFHAYMTTLNIFTTSNLDGLYYIDSVPSGRK